MDQWDPVLILQITDNLRDVKVMAKVDTLKSIIKKSGDSGKKISYLKIDIESSELDAIHDWIRCNKCLFTWLEWQRIVVQLNRSCQIKF